MGFTRHRNFVPALCALVFVVWVNGWLLPALTLSGVCWMGWQGYKRLEQKRAADAVIAARADYEHALTLRGDERGVYGQGWPTMKKYQQVSRREANADR